MEQEFPNVWFATEKQIKNRARFFNFSDRGSLTSSSGRLQFKGHKHNITIQNIKTIDVVYPLVPWVSLALSIIFSGIFLGLFSWSTNALRVIITAPFVIFFVVYLMFWVLIQKSMLWVEVTYSDDNNVLQHVYFFDGSVLGWRGILGGSLEMYKSLKQRVILAAG